MKKILRPPQSRLSGFCVWLFFWLLYKCVCVFENKDRMTCSERGWWLWGSGCVVAAGWGSQADSLHASNWLTDCRVSHLSESCRDPAQRERTRPWGKADREQKRRMKWCRLSAWFSLMKVRGLKRWFTQKSFNNREPVWLFTFVEQKKEKFSRVFTLFLLYNEREWRSGTVKLRKLDALKVVFRVLKSSEVYSFLWGKTEIYLMNLNYIDYIYYHLKVWVW